MSEKVKPINGLNAQNRPEGPSEEEKKKYMEFMDAKKEAEGRKSVLTQAAEIYAKCVIDAAHLILDGDGLNRPEINRVEFFSSLAQNSLLAAETFHLQVTKKISLEVDAILKKFL